MQNHKFLLSVIIAGSMCIPLTAMRHDNFGDNAFGDNLEHRDESRKSSEVAAYEAQLNERRNRLNKVSNPEETGLAESSSDSTETKELMKTDALRRKTEQEVFAHQFGASGSSSEESVTPELVNDQKEKALEKSGVQIVDEVISEQKEERKLTPRAKSMILEVPSNVQSHDAPSQEEKIQHVLDVYNANLVNAIKQAEEERNVAASPVNAAEIEEDEMEAVVNAFVDNFDMGIERKREEEKKWLAENKDKLDELFAREKQAIQAESEQLNNQVAQALEAQVQEQTGEKVEVSGVVINNENALEEGLSAQQSEQIPSEPIVQNNPVGEQEPDRPFAKPEVLVMEGAPEVVLQRIPEQQSNVNQSQNTNEVNAPQNLQNNADPVIAPQPEASRSQQVINQLKSAGKALPGYFTADYLIKDSKRDFSFGNLKEQKYNILKSGALCVITVGAISGIMYGVWAKFFKNPETDDLETDLEPALSLVEGGNFEQRIIDLN